MEVTAERKESIIFGHSMDIFYNFGPVKKERMKWKSKEFLCNS